MGLVLLFYHKLAPSPCKYFVITPHERGRSGTRAISTTSRHELSSSFFPARQGAEGNSHLSERNISLFPSWSG